MDGWRDFAIAEEIGRLCPYPVTLCNDATSACAAEFFLGEAWRERDFLYFFVGVFLGGGLVLDGALYIGRTGNAAALGSMPISAPGGSGSSQLIACASLYQLESGSRRRGAIPPRSVPHARGLGRFRRAAGAMDRGSGLRASRRPRSPPPR